MLSSDRHEAMDRMNGYATRIASERDRAVAERDALIRLLYRPYGDHFFVVGWDDRLPMGRVLNTEAETVAAIREAAGLDDAPAHAPAPAAWTVRWQEQGEPPKSRSFADEAAARRWAADKAAWPSCMVTLVGPDGRPTPIGATTSEDPAP